MSDTNPNALIKIHPLVVRDIEIEVYMSATGQFVAEFGNKKFRSPTRDDLYKALMVATKRPNVKVQIPFCVIRERAGEMTLRYGVASGIHATTRKVLVRWDDTGESDQLLMDDVYRPLDEVTGTALIELHRQLGALRNQIRAFEHEHGFRLSAEVSRAVEAKAREAE